MCECQKTPNNRVTLLDIFLSIITCGYWVIWMYYRPNRKK